jgi:signal transduction histidine kinase/CheY-like chemotaxis protein
MNIRLKIVAPLIIFLSVFLSIFFIFFIEGIKNSWEDDLLVREKGALSLMAQAITPDIISYDLEKMRNTLSNIEESRDWWHAIVVNNIEGVQLYPVFSQVDSKFPLRIESEVISNNLAIGTVSVEIDIEGMSETLFDVINKFFISVVALLFLGLIITYIINNYFIIKPINSLVSAVKKLFNGTYQVGRFKESSDEFGVLFSTFDKTASYIQNQHLELKKSKERAENLNNAKSQFLSNMSHEMRTPLNGILGLTELIKNSLSEGKESEYLDKITSSGKHLLQVINDLLDFSKIESGKFTLTEVEFSFIELFDNALNVMGLQAEKKGVELVFDIEEGFNRILLGDPVRIYQVLLNLLSNAVKFTSDGEVIVTARFKPSHGGGEEVEISVKDTGRGINEDDLKSLFKPFKQVGGGLSRSHEGTGLGLVISRKLIEMMGGKLCVTSSENAGSNFYFNLELKTLQSGFDKSKFERPYRMLYLDEGRFSALISTRLNNMGAKVSHIDDFSLFMENNNDILSFINEFDLILFTYENNVNSTLLLSIFCGFDKKITSPFLVVSPIMELPRFDTLEFVSKLVVKPVYGESLYALINDMFSSSSEKNTKEDMIKPLDGLCVLSVDDHEINQIVICDMLESSGAKVEQVGNGELAIDAIKNRTFDVVLMDIQMPVMDGLTAMKIIKSNNLCENTSIIAVTANVVNNIEREYVESGFDAILSKPYESNKLFDTIEKCLKR